MPSASEVAGLPYRITALLRVAYGNCRRATYQGSLRRNRWKRRAPHEKHLSRDRATWLTFDAACDALRDFLVAQSVMQAVVMVARNSSAASAFTLSGRLEEKSAVLMGVDLESCVGAGGMEDWALRVIEAIPGYWEISPSGSGVKLLAGIEDGHLEAVRGGAWTRGLAVTGLRGSKEGARTYGRVARSATTGAERGGGEAEHE